MLNGRKDNAVVKKMGWKRAKNQGEVGYARPQIVGATFAPAAPKQGRRQPWNRVVPADRGSMGPGCRELQQLPPVLQETLI